MNGHASNIWVTLHKDGSSITIDDDGRGIPIDKHPTSKKSALEVIFTVLHAGGKFDHDNYKTAGGLHGVGASVVNALSKELVATVRRDGAEWEQRFKQGKPLGPPKKIGSGARQRHQGVLPSGPRHLSEDRARAGAHPRTPRGGQLHPQGAEDRVRERSGQDERDVRARRGPARVPEEDRGRAQRRSRCTMPVLAREAERAAARSRAAVDGVDRGARPQLRERHSDRRRAARTRTACAPGLGKAVRNFIDTHNLSPKGVTHHARRTFARG